MATGGVDFRRMAPNRRLIVRLTKLGELERVLEFHAGNDGARVIGSAPSSDVVLGDAGVLAVHCYLERDAGYIWLAAAQDAAPIRVNYRPIVGRVKLAARSIIEVGAARMQALVLDADEKAPRHGPFGTEVIARDDFALVADHFVTTPVDVSVALGEYPTAAWPSVDMARASAVGSLAPPTHPSAATLEYEACPEQSSLAVAPGGVRDQRAALSTLTATMRIPRPSPTLACRTEPIQPVVPLPCIVVQPPPVLPDSTPLVQEQPLGADSAGNTVTEGAAFPTPAVSLVDPGNFRTIGYPISDVFTAGEPVNPSGSSQPAKNCARSFASLRQRFAVGLGREPKVVALIALFAALSLGALAKQSVRLWRQLYVPVVAASANPPRVIAARETTPHGIVASAEGRLGGASTALVASAEDVVPSSGDRDAVVAQAVNHLLLGNQVEAAEAYGVLAARYPSELAYARIAKVLRRRLDPACREGKKGECRKVVP